MKQSYKIILASFINPKLTATQNSKINSWTQTGLPSNMPDWPRPAQRSDFVSNKEHTAGFF